VSRHGQILFRDVIDPDLVALTLARQLDLDRVFRASLYVRGFVESIAAGQLADNTAVFFVYQDLIRVSDGSKHA